MNKSVLFFKFLNVKKELIHSISIIYYKIFKTKPNHIKPIIKCEYTYSSKIEEYWNKHTIEDLTFYSKYEVKQYYKWLIKQYPLYDILFEHSKNRTGEVIIDYGCGPGNDLYRLLVLNKASKLYGFDVSLKALQLAQKRISLFDIALDKYELFQISDLNPVLPIQNENIDHINCSGVLHHISYPNVILSEFYRVLKPGSSGLIMVYNYYSIWVHLYTAYQKMIIENKYSDYDVLEAFSKTTDGENCPISQCYKPEKFSKLCETIGFEVQFMGGYLSVVELTCLSKYMNEAIIETKLGEEHKEFLSKLEYDKNGMPMYDKKYAGIGGVYKIYKY